MYKVDGDSIKSVLWIEYLDTLSKIGALRDFGAFDGGETIGKDGPSATCYDPIVGYLRIQVESMAEARHLLSGNPIFERGGFISIRKVSSPF